MSEQYYKNYVTKFTKKACKTKGYVIKYLWKYCIPINFV